MSNQKIPFDIVHGILSQLPVKTLLRFKSVSREWFSLINDPYFIKLHLKCSMETKRNNLNIILRDGGSGKLISAGFDYVNLDNPRELNHPMQRGPGEGLDDDYEKTFVRGSCNGLLCLINEDQTHGTVVLWNMATLDYKVLPDQPVELPPEWSPCRQVTFYGFGYDSINDDYKLVRIAQKRSPPIVSDVKVYCLKTNTWKKGDAISPNYSFHESWRMEGTFVFGALHWFGLKKGVRYPSCQCVIAFDVATEKYHEIELVDNMKHKTEFMATGALGGCLCVIAVSWEDEIKVWMMKDYGVKESWTMLYSFEGDILTAGFFQPLAYSKNHDKILLSLSWYDIKGEELEDTNLPQLKTLSNHSDICMESLVKLS